MPGTPSTDATVLTPSNFHSIMAYTYYDQPCTLSPLDVVGVQKAYRTKPAGIVVSATGVSTSPAP